VAIQKKKKIKYSPINEQIVIGSMLKSSTLRKRLVKELSIKNFTAARHKVIFSALIEITDRNLDTTLGTIQSFIPKDEDYGGKEYLDKLEDLSSESNIEYHIIRTKWDVTRNNIILKKLPELEGMLRDPRLDPNDTLNFFNKVETQIKNIITDDKSIQFGKDVGTRYRATECARDIGVFDRSSGYPVIDNLLTECFSPGKMTVMSAASSIGKTTFCINMAARQCNNYKIGYMPWEGGINSTIDTLCACIGRIPQWKLIKRRDLLTQDEIIRKNAVLEEYIDTGKIKFLEPPPASLTKGKAIYEVNDLVMDWFERKLEEWDVDIFYWDLFEHRFRDKQPNSIAWLLTRLQSILNGSNKHGVLLHQITFKEVEKNKNKRPTRAYLKGTGGYIETPDVVFTAYREGYYERSIPDDTFELTCQKQRKGKLFRVLFHWDGETCRMSKGKEVDMNDDNWKDLEV
jgi:replicative DNA helicase